MDTEELDCQFLHLGREALGAQTNAPSVDYVISNVLCLILKTVRVSLTTECVIARYHLMPERSLNVKDKDKVV